MGPRRGRKNKRLREANNESERQEEGRRHRPSAVGNGSRTARKTKKDEDTTGQEIMKEGDGAREMGKEDQTI